MEATKGNEEMTTVDLDGMPTSKEEMMAGEPPATKPIKTEMLVVEAGVNLPSRTLKLKVEAGTNPPNQKKTLEEVAGTEPKQLHPRRTTTEAAGEPTGTARKTAAEVDGELCSPNFKIYTSSSSFFKQYICQVIN